MVAGLMQGVGGYAERRSLNFFIVPPQSLEGNLSNSYPEHDRRDEQLGMPLNESRSSATTGSIAGQPDTSA